MLAIILNLRDFRRVDSHGLRGGHAKQLMNTYELLYIIPATLTDEEVRQTELDAQALIKKYGGIVKESRQLGKFRLAYLIKKVRHGYYVLVYFEAEPQVVAKINEAFRIYDRCLRHLIVRADEAGGSEFNLVQYQEVVVDGGKDERSKRKKQDREKAKVAEDVQAAAELDKDEEETETEEVAGEEVEKIEEATGETMVISQEELDKKIDEALQGEV